MHEHDEKVLGTWPSQPSLRAQCRIRRDSVTTQATVTCATLNVRALASTTSQIIGKLERGTHIEVQGRVGDWDGSSAAIAVCAVIWT